MQRIPFFGVLNESFPGCYDRCVHLQRLFVDSWFDGVSRASDVSDAMIHITGVKSQFVAFFHKYMREKAADKEEYFRTLKANDFMPQTIETQMISMLDDMLLEVKLTREAEAGLLTQLLEVLARSNPQRADILKAFRTHCESVR